MPYLEKLKQSTETGNVCVGIDPVISRLPEHLREKSDGLKIFCSSIVRATSPYAAAYKPNLAFFEALGNEGSEALKHLIDSVREYAPNAILIGDGKRGDIGSTAELYAEAMFKYWGFDAVTVNPYFGTDGIRPFTDYADRGVYLLGMTTNPSAIEVQDHGGEDDPLYLWVAHLAETLWNENGNVGLVVGATRAERISRVREKSPSLPFLIPGVGAQGGDLESVVINALGANQPPGLVNSSRGIIYASSDGNFAKVAGEKTKEMRDLIIKCCDTNPS